ncbi:MAG: methyltransferase [Bacillota bacterium]
MDDMADHYFTEMPESPHKPMRFQAEYRGHSFTFQTDSGVFSRTAIDRGSRELLDALPDGMIGDVLDMGCGYGTLGVCLKKHNPGCRLLMADINARAVALAAENAAQNGVSAEVLQSNGFEALADRTFDLIVLNPPIRAGKQVVYRMFSHAARALREGGALMLVIRRQQGAPSAAAALRALFQSVHILSKKGGYWVIRCENGVAKV